MKKFSVWLETQIPVLPVADLYNRLKAWIKKVEKDRSEIRNIGFIDQRLSNIGVYLDDYDAMWPDGFNKNGDINLVQRFRYEVEGLAYEIRAMFYNVNREDLTPLERELFDLSKLFDAADTTYYQAMSNRKGVRGSPKFILGVRDDYILPRSVRSVYRRAVPGSLYGNENPEMVHRANLMRYYNVVRGLLPRHPAGKGILNALERDNGIYDPVNWVAAFDALEEMDSRAAELRSRVMQTLQDIGPQ